MRSSLSISLSLAVGAAAMAGAQAAPQSPAPKSSSPAAPPATASAAARPAAAPAHSTAVWKPYVAKDGSFGALLPGIPTVGVQRDGIGEDQPMEHLFVVTDGATVYTVEYTDDLDAALQMYGPQRLLTTFDWGFFREVGSKKVEATAIRVSGLPGREIRLTTAAGRTKLFRACIIGGRFYHWGVSAPEGTDVSASAEKLFGSFAPGRPAAARPATAGKPAAGAKTPADGKVAAAALAAPVTQPAQPGTQPAPVAAQPGKAAAPKRTPWRVVRVPEGGFSVLAPDDKPDEATVQITPATTSKKAAKAKKASGRKLNFTNEAESYSAGWEPAEASTSGDLWALRERTAAALNGKVLSSVPVEKDGFPGEELHLQLPDDLSAVVRVYQAPGRVYTLTAITPMERSYSEGSVRFLKSFKLLKK